MSKSSRSRVTSRIRTVTPAAGLAAVTLAALVPAGPASAATASSASFWAVSGKSVTKSGVLVVAPGATVKLGMTAAAPAKCIQVRGSHWDTLVSGTAKTWFASNAYTVWNGDGARTETLTAYSDYGVTAGSPWCKGKIVGSATASYLVDGTAPTVTATLDGTANAAGWTKNGTVRWTASDSGVGVNTSTVPAPVVSPQGITYYQKTVKDLLGNARTSWLTVRTDSGAPTIAATITPAPNNAGWVTSPATVAFQCSDATSGIASCSSPRTIGTDNAGTTVTGTATDVAGNSTSTTATVRVDTVAPVLTGKITSSAASNGAYSGLVTVQWTCSDVGSGLAGACPAPTTVLAQGGRVAVRMAESDIAGNRTETLVEAGNPHTVLLGATANYDGAWGTDALLAYESDIGRKLNVVRTWKRWDEQLWSMDADIRDGGRINFMTIGTEKANGANVRWSAIAAAAPGTAEYDNLVRWAKTVKGFGGQFWINFDHEPEEDGNGTSAEYRAAFRKVVQVFREQGVTNVRFATVLMAWSFKAPSETGTGVKADDWFPGADVADIMAVDGYNWLDCRGTNDAARPFATIFDAARQWGLAHPTVAMGVAEYGTVESADPAAKAAWIQDAAGTLAAPGWEQFTLASYFNVRDNFANTTRDCNWQIESSSLSIAGMAKAVTSPIWAAAPR